MLYIFPITRIYCNWAKNFPVSLPADKFPINYDVIYYGYRFEKVTRFEGLDTFGRIVALLTAL